MAAKRNNQASRIVEPGLRCYFREKQIEAIKAKVREAYAHRIRAAKSKDERLALEAQLDAEIAKLTEQLVRESELDTPECL